MQPHFIQEKIFEIRGQNVMLDFDLAALYNVETRVLNQAVKRNIDRFPEDFMFRIKNKEWTVMRSQIVIASEQIDENLANNWSQFVSLDRQRVKNQLNPSSQVMMKK